jgi:hypothetical protein
VTYVSSYVGARTYKGNTLHAKETIAAFVTGTNVVTSALYKMDSFAGNIPWKDPNA